VPSVTIKHIGCLLTGDASRPLRDADTLYVEDGVVRQIGGPAQDAELVIDARGSTVAPGLIDAHTHPSFGEYTPTQDATHWIRNYLHGGITSVVSAGELHVPGLPLDHPDPQLFKWLAILARRTYAAPGPWGARVYAGTPMVTPGMTERDFDDFQREGIRLVKFIFYPFKDAPAGEAESYVRWAHARGIRVKIHSGGVSRSGVSQMAGVEIMKRLRPDVVAHVNGGPIPMPLDEVLDGLRPRALQRRQLPDRDADDPPRPRSGRAAPTRHRQRHPERNGRAAARHAAQRRLCGVGVRRPPRAGRLLRHR